MSQKNDTSPARQIADMLYEKLDDAELTKLCQLMASTDLASIRFETGKLRLRSERDAAPSRRARLRAVG